MTRAPRAPCRTARTVRPVGRARTGGVPGTGPPSRPRLPQLTRAGAKVSVSGGRCAPPGPPLRRSSRGARGATIHRVTVVHRGDDGRRADGAVRWAVLIAQWPACGVIRTALNWRPPAAGTRAPHPTRPAPRAAPVVDLPRPWLAAVRLPLSALAPLIVSSVVSGLAFQRPERAPIESTPSRARLPSRPGRWDVHAACRSGARRTAVCLT
jgi:hypothetical protein